MDSKKWYSSLEELERAYGKCDYSHFVDPGHEVVYSNGESYEITSDPGAYLPPEEGMTYFYDVDLTVPTAECPNGIFIHADVVQAMKDAIEAKESQDE